MIAYLEGLNPWGDKTTFDRVLCDRRRDALQAQAAQFTTAYQQQTALWGVTLTLESGRERPGPGCPHGTRGRLGPGGYSHVTPEMRQELVEGLTELWLAALAERHATSPHSPVPVLDELLRSFDEIQ